ncbi:hypothetical protein [Dysosmobacter sp.]
MASITGSDLKQPVRVLRLKHDETESRYVWAEDYPSWVKAEQDTRSNLFSAVGIGARGVTFMMRKNKRLSLFHAIRWQGQFCFLTSITDAEPGFVTVKAALCEPVLCQKDADKTPPGCQFPGILTEKYVGHSQPDFHAEVTTDYVLVTPKAVELAPGSWVIADGRYYRVRVPHLLDPYKNEFEIRRKEDC